MDKNYLCYLRKNLDKYLGEWIAIGDDKVIAHGVDLKVVYAKAKKISNRPLIAKVPHRNAMIF